MNMQTDPTVSNPEIDPTAKVPTFFRLDEEGLKRLMPCLEQCGSVAMVKTKKGNLVDHIFRRVDKKSINVEFATANGLKNLEFKIEKYSSRLIQNPSFILTILYGGEVFRNYGIMGFSQDNQIAKMYAQFNGAVEGINYMDDQQRIQFLDSIKLILAEYSKK